MESKFSLGFQTYGKVYFSVLKELDISAAEYLFLEMVRLLSPDEKWCFMTRTRLADQLNMDRGSVIRMIARMVKRNLLMVHPDTNRLKPTKKFTLQVDEFERSNGVAYQVKHAINS